MALKRIVVPVAIKLSVRAAWIVRRAVICCDDAREGKFISRVQMRRALLRRRVNCEQVPFLPAWAVAWVLHDPRKIPYLLIWKSRSDGTVKEAARIVPYYEAAGRGGPDWSEAFEIKRHDGTRDFIRTLPAQ